MDVEIRSLTADELDRWIRGLIAAFLAEATDEELESNRREVLPERGLVATEGDAFVGGAAAYPMRLAVPGGDAPFTAVVSAWVAPTHRRRGILRAVMRRQLEEVHGRGEALAGLWASEGAIYGRFGFGLATFACGISIERSRGAFASPIAPYGSARLVDREEFLRRYPPVYERARGQRPGMVSRDELWVEHRFMDLERQRDGMSPYFFAVLEGPGGDEGYAVYRFRHDWSEALPTGLVRVEELIATTPEALASLWRFVLDLDLAGRVEAFNRPADDPLFHLLLEPRALRLTIRDGVWVRLVDVPAALSARRYAREDRIVLEVRDDFCPWNEGRYALDGGQDGAVCHRTDEDPDVVLSVADLGAAYLGGTRLETLAAAGRVRELRDGALERAGQMFAWAPAPWTAHIF